MRESVLIRAVAEPMKNQIDLGALLSRLDSEVARLDMMIDCADGGYGIELRTVRDHLRDATTSLRALTVTDASARAAAMMPSKDAFRTRVTLKALAKRVPQVEANRSPTAVTLPTPADGEDDLTRIRGIDAGLRARLAALGIRTFGQIAALRGDDVRSISDELALGRQISRQNWIEQAALLINPVATAEPDALPRSRFTSVLPTPDIIPVDDDDTIGTVDGDPPPFAVEAVRLPGGSYTIDRLDLIQGIDGSMLARLMREGVTSFRSIANWTRADIDRVESALKAHGQVSRQNWIEQAALLAHKGTSAFAARRIAGPPDVLCRAESEPPRSLAPLLLLPVSLPAEVEGVKSDPAAFLTASSADQSPTPDEIPEPSLSSYFNFDNVSAEQLLPVARIEAVVDCQPESSAVSIEGDERKSEERAERHDEKQHVESVSAGHVEDAEFDELSVAEADVMIVQRRPRSQPVRSAAKETTRSLLSRLISTAPLENIDPANYAAYRDQIEEASVEIVKRPRVVKLANEPSPALVRDGTKVLKS